VVGGSNPLTPTKNLASKSLAKSHPVPPDPGGVHNFVNTFVDTLCKEIPRPDLFNQLSLIQQHQQLSDRALARTLGISRSHLSYLHRGLRKPSHALVTRIIAIFPQLGYLFPEELIISRPFFASITRRENMDAKKTSLKQASQNFLIAKQAEGKSKDTMSFYGENLERIIWWFDTFRPVKFIEEITTHHLRELLVYVRTATNRWRIGSISSRKPATKSTVDAYWRTLQSLFSWLVREEIIDPQANPMKKIPRPDFSIPIIKDIPLKLIKKASEESGRTIFTAARNRAIILVFLDTGVRLGAISGMTVSNTDPETGLATLLEKGGRELVIHLGKTSLVALRQYLTVRQDFDSDSLWLKEDGTPLKKSAIQSMIRRLKRFGGGVRWTPHTFRNTWAINLLRGGADTFSLQTLGGWVDLEMPRRYTRAMKIEDAINVHKKASPADRMENETQ